MSFIIDATRVSILFCLSLTSVLSLSVTVGLAASEQTMKVSESNSSGKLNLAVDRKSNKSNSSKTSVSSAYIEAEKLAKQAAQLSTAGKFEEALELEKKASQLAPDYWVPHAGLSYIAWHTSDFDEAFKEANTAVKLAPDNATTLINYAQLQQLMGALDEAIPVYTKASKIAPENWVPLVYKAQCLALLARKPEAAKVLEQMSLSKSSSFEWWYELADTYLKLEDFDKAERYFQKALPLAATDAQRSACLSQVLVAAIENNDMNSANAVRSKVFSYHTTDEPVYLKTAKTLIPDNEPAQAQLLLMRAQESGITDSAFYYSLGKIFSEKNSSGTRSAAADMTPSEKGERLSWSVVTSHAYAKAIALDPSQSKYHLALAEIYDRSGDRKDLLEELERAKGLEATDALASYLISKVNGSSTTSSAGLPQPSSAPSADYALNITNILVNVDKVHCACKLPSIEKKLRAIPGVVFAGVAHSEKPFKLTILVDQSVVATSQLESALASAFPEVSFQVASTEPVRSAASAINVAKQLIEGHHYSLTYGFKQASLIMPMI